MVEVISGKNKFRIVNQSDSDKGILSDDFFIHSLKCPNCGIRSEPSTRTMWRASQTECPLSWILQLGGKTAMEKSHHKQANVMREDDCRKPRSNIRINTWLPEEELSHWDLGDNQDAARIGQVECFRHMDSFCKDLAWKRARLYMRNY